MHNTYLPFVLDDENWRDFARTGREACAIQLKYLTRNLVWFALREYLMRHQDAGLRFNYSRENNSDRYPAVILIDVEDLDSTKINTDLFNPNVVMNTYSHESDAADGELWLFAKMLHESTIIFRNKNIEDYQCIFFTPEQQAVARDKKLRAAAQEGGTTDCFEKEEIKKI